LEIFRSELRMLWATSAWWLGSRPDVASETLERASTPQPICRHIATAAQLQAASIGDTLQDAIEERPLSAVAFALGPGFLMGVMWRR
jgi:hypothetical protein